MRVWFTVKVRAGDREVDRNVPEFWIEQLFALPMAWLLVRALNNKH